MNTCRVCRFGALESLYDAEAPSLTSMTTLAAAATSVFACPRCGHAQTADLPNVEDFYDSQYRISLDSAEHDQIVMDARGQAVFRTQLQADLVLRFLNPRQGCAILDFGAAKAQTLRRVVEARPDLDAYVFDVSEDYAASWNGWLPNDHVATYRTPPSWQGRFDIVTAHFVLEHVVEPVTVLALLHSLLKPGGTLLVTVPSCIANPGDLIVADHLSHFSRASLSSALTRAGFVDTSIHGETALPGALLAVATSRIASRTASRPGAEETDLTALRAVAESWRSAHARLREASVRHRGRRAAIFGAGFYGSWIAATLKAPDNLVCFVDNNPHISFHPVFALPVVRPSDLPKDVEVLYVGLNPIHARAILDRYGEMSRVGLDLVWLSSAAGESVGDR